MLKQQDPVIATLSHHGNSNAPGAAAANPVLGAIPLNAFDHGHILANQLNYRGLNLSAQNANAGPDLAVAFDSNSRETSNPQLEGPNSFDRKKWIGGNIKPNQNLGTLLILQEHGYDAEGQISTWPEAQPNSPAGQITFDFTHPILAFGFDIVGCEGPATPSLDANFAIEFFLENQSLGRVGFSDFLNPQSTFFDPHNPVQFGPRSANRINPIPAIKFGADAFDRATLSLGGACALGSFLLKSDATPTQNFRFPG
jgi:hypothetical protein